MTDANVNAKFTADTKGFTKAVEGIKKSLIDLTTKTFRLINKDFDGFNKTLTANEKVLNNTDKVIRNLGKTAKSTALDIGVATKAFGALMAVQDKMFVAQTGFQIFDIAAKGIRDVVNELSSLDDAFKVMDISGISRQSIQEFGLLQEAIKGNTVALEQFSLTAISRYNQFAEELAYVNTMAGLGTKELSKYGDEILDLVNNKLNNAVTSSEALAGAYEVISAGFVKAADNQAVMVAGMKLATTGASDQGQTMRLLGKVLNALGESSVDAGKRASGIFEIVRQGITTVSELNLGLGETTTVARAAGVSFEEVGGGVARLTAAGKSTPSALTGLESLFRIIIDKTPQAEKALRDLRDSAGKPIKFDKREIETKGLVKAIQDLNEAVGGNEQKLAAIIPESQAFGTFLALAADNAEVFRQKVDAMGKATEQTLEIGFVQKLDNTKAKFQAVANKFSEMLITIGKAIAPAFEGGVDALSRLADIMAFLTPIIAKTLEVLVPIIKTVARLTGAVTTFLGAAGGIAGVILSFRAFNLLMTGQLPRQIEIIKQLAFENKNWFAAIKQAFGINQEHLLITKRTQEEYTKLKKKTDDLIAAHTGVANVEEKLAKTRTRTNKVIQEEENALKNLGVAKEALVKQQKALQEQYDLNPNNDKLREELDLTDKNIAKTDELIESKKQDITVNKNRIVQQEQRLDAAKKEALIIKDEEGNVHDLNKELAKYEKNMEGAINANQTLHREREKLDKLTNNYNNNLKQLEKSESNAATAAGNIEALTQQRRKLYSVINSGNEAEIKQAQEQILLINERIQQEEILLKFERNRQIRLKEKVDVSDTAVKEQQIILDEKSAAVKEHLIVVSKRKAEIDALEANAIRLSNAAKKQAVIVDALKNKEGVTAAEITAAETLSINLNTQAEKANIAVIKAKNVLQKEEIALSNAQLVAEGKLFKARLFNKEVLVENNTMTRIFAKDWGQATKEIGQGFSKVAKGASEAMQKAGGGLKGLGAALKGGFGSALGSMSLFQGGITLTTGAILGLGAAAAGVVVGLGYLASQGFQPTTEAAQKMMDLTKENTGTFAKYNKEIEELNQELTGTKETIKTTTHELTGLEKAFAGVWDITKQLWRTIWTGLREGALQKTINTTSAAILNLQDATIGLIKVNKDLEKGKALSVESNEKIRRGMQLNVADMEREQKLFEKRKVANDALISQTEAAIKSLTELRDKEDDPRHKEVYEQEIKLAQTQLDKYKEQNKELEKQYDNFVKLTEARNKFLALEQKYSLKTTTDSDVKATKESLIAAQKELKVESDKLSKSVNANLLSNHKQLITDLSNGTLATKNAIEQLGVDSSKFTQEELNTVTESIEKEILHRKLIWHQASKDEQVRWQELKNKGTKNLKELLNTDEFKKKFSELGVDITKLTDSQLDKLKVLFEKTNGDISKVNVESLKKLGVAVEQATDKNKQALENFKNSIPEVMGKSPIETAIKKDLKAAEDAITNTVTKIEAAKKGLTNFEDINLTKFINKAVVGQVTDLTLELQKLGIAASDVEPDKLEALKTAITGKNEVEIKAALKAIGVEIDKTFTGAEVSSDQFEKDLSTFLESLDAGVEQGFVTGQEAAKRMDEMLVKLKDKLEPEDFIALINKQLEYEKKAVNDRIKLYEHQSNIINQLENNRLLTGVNIVKFLSKLQEKQLEDNIKFIELQLDKYKKAGLENSEKYKELERQLTQFQTQQVALRIKNMEAEIDAINERTKESLDTRKDLLEEQTLQGVLTKKDEAKKLYEIEQESIKADIKSTQDKINRFAESKNEIIKKAVQAGMTQIEAENAYQDALDKLNKQGIKNRVNLLKSEVNERQRLLDEEKKEISDKYSKETALVQEKNSKGLKSEYETTKEIIEIKKKELEKKIVLFEKEIELARAKGEDITAMEATLANMRTELNKTNTEEILNDIEERNKIMQDGIADQRRAIESSIEARTTSEEEGAKQLSVIRLKELDNTIKDLEAKKATYIESGKDIRDIDNQIQDARLEKVKTTNNQILKELSDAQAKINGIAAGKTLKVELDNASGKKSEIETAREITQVKQEQLKAIAETLTKQLTLVKSEKERIDIQNQILANQKEQKQLATDILLKEVEHRNKLLSKETGDVLREQEKLNITGKQSEIDMERKVTAIKIQELNKREKLLKEQVQIYKNSGKDTIDLETQIQDNRVEKIRLANGQIIKDLDYLVNKTKTINDKAVINEEIAVLNNLKSQEESDNQLYKLKIKALNDDEALIKKRIGIFKQQGKDTLALENELLNITKEKKKLSFEEELQLIERQQTKIADITNNRIIKVELAVADGYKTEYQASLETLNIKRQQLKESLPLLEHQLKIVKSEKERREIQNQILTNQKEQKQIATDLLLKEIEHQNKLLSDKTGDAVREQEKLVLAGQQSEIDMEKNVTNIKIQELDKRENLILNQIKVYKKSGKDTIDLENQIQDNRVEKIRLANNQIIKDLDNLTNKTKLVNDKAILKQELSALNGLKTEEQVNKDIYKLKLKSFHDDEELIKKRIATYKKQGKDTLALENELLNISKQRRQAAFDEEIKDIELRQSKLLTIENNRITASQIASATGVKTEIESAKEITQSKLRQIDIESKAVLEQIDTYKKKGKDVRLLEEQLQKYRLDKIQLTNAQEKANLENQIKDREVGLAKEKTLLDIEYKTRKISFEQYEELQVEYQQKELNLREDTLKKRIAFMKKHGEDTRDIEKELEQIQIQRSDIVTQRIITNLNKQKQASDLYYNNEKHLLDKQLQNVEFLSKSLEMQKQLSDSKVQLIQTELDLNVQELDLEKRKTFDLRTQAELTYQQAQKRFEALKQQQDIEVKNIEYQKKANTIAEQREEIQIRQNKLQIQQQRTQVQIEIIRARTENRSKLELQTLEQQLKLIDDQLIYADKSAEQQRQQRVVNKEILEDQIKQNEAKSKMAMQGGILDMEIAKLEKQKAFAEAKIQDIQQEIQQKEIKSNVEVQALEHITKQYQEQVNILQQKQQMLGELQSMWEQNMNIVVNAAKNEYKQKDLRIEMEKTKIKMLKEQHRIENIMFELGLKTKEIELEKLEIQQKINKAKAEAEVLTKQVNLDNMMNDSRSTEAQKKSASLELYAAQVNLKGLEATDALIQQQRESNRKMADITRAMNEMKQENQVIGANVSLASLTNNRADDDIVARYAREQAGRNLALYNDVLNKVQPNEVTPLAINIKEIERVLAENLAKSAIINKGNQPNITPAPIGVDNTKLTSFNKQTLVKSTQVTQQEQKNVTVSAPITINIELNRNESTDANAAQTLANTFHRQLQNVINNASYNS